MERIAESRHEHIWKLVDARLELVVVWAIGDASGPAADAGEVKIGVSTRASFDDHVKQMGKYRAADVKVYFETIVSGKGRGEMLKTALLATLGDRGFSYRSFRRATVGEIDAIIGNLSRTYRVKLYTHDEAVALEHETFEKIASEHAGA